MKYEEKLEKLQFECNEYKVYSPDSMNPITDKMKIDFSKKIIEYKNFFDIDNFRQIQVNIFDDYHKFREFIRDLRDGRDSLPSYAIGTYDEGMINCYIENNDLLNDYYVNSKFNLISHELFHIMYMEIILKNDYSNRVIWYDEGMAQLMSGQKENLKDAKFNVYLDKVIDETTIFPNINSIEHGKNFTTSEYNGYDLSYLAVRYLKETMDEESFKKISHDFSKIREYGDTIIFDMFDHYKVKTNEEGIKLR